MSMPTAVTSGEIAVSLPPFEFHLSQITTWAPRSASTTWPAFAATVFGLAMGVKDSSPVAAASTIGPLILLKSKAPVGQRC